MSAELAEAPDGQDLALARLMHLARRRPLTISDIEGLSPGFGRTELIDGMLILTPNPDFEHQDLCVELTHELNKHVPVGFRAYSATNVFEPGTDRSNLIPDVVVVDRSKIVSIHGQGEGAFPDALSLAIEITSSNREVDLGVKRERYETWGVPYLVVDRKSTPHAYRVFGDWPLWAQHILPT